MDILLSHGYFIAEDEHEQKIMKPYPTLGLLYISSHLKARGFDVHLYDTTFQTMADFAEMVRRERPGLVGLYCNLMTKQNILRQVQLCREVGAKVVLGGPEPVNYAQEYLAAGVDIVVVGEGEETLEELIPHLARHGLSGLEAVQGIIFGDGDGRPVRTPARPQIKDLSAQPWPDREAIDMDRYLATWKTHHGLSSVSLITARGCPYVCNWCSHSVFGHTHRRRRPEEVVEEVTWIKERYNPDQLWYADDVLTIHPRWFLAYAGLLKERGLRLPFECISRADRLNEAVIEALDGMGCYRLWIGAESGSQRILDGMERKANVADIQAKTKLLQARGIEVGMFIMLGYEGEEIADLEATVDHLKKSNPDVFLTTVAYPIKGTKYHDRVAGRVVAPHNWLEHTDRDLKVAGRYSRRFYDHATRWMVNEVNLNKARLTGSHDYLHMARMFVNAQRGRLGMYLSRHEREEGEEQPPSGRGWAARERAADAW
ncbi:MAG: B12-binding domain-containing radical SAM protein [Chloroflexi bacterium]|nr:B12-binding domain-containing radical SAM protein [Chloroflexota bacterium]MCI0576669.1 B12-binding domain-containing radical SAM protein [Chloroflexota bacterium]MCI0647982.1 B12-binding domain-containing radical SAM protein [Chloroflexota bacterium]MCI0726808.1 B12-binding domain-containing radical SAM protein [Chloroflexota bacterium]